MSKQTIYLGAVANDKTGNKLRVGGNMINSNFDELYSRNHACCGSKQEFRDAIMEFAVKERALLEFFYVSKIIAGAISPYNQYLRVYEVDINKASNLTSVGTQVLKFYIQSIPLNSPKSSPEVVTLTGALASPPTDFFGEICIDWSKFILGQTYTCANWLEGGLYVVNTIKAASDPGGDPGPGFELPYGSGTSKFNITEAAVIDGSFNLYLASLTTGEISLASADVIKGKIDLKNIAEVEITINCILIPPIESDPSTPALFDGLYQQIIVAAYKQVSFELYHVENRTYMTIVSGDYTGVEEK